MRDYPMFGGFNRHDTSTFDAEDLVNWYMRVDPAGKKKYAFINTPGSQLKLTLEDSTSPVRALYVPDFDNTKLYLVANDVFYSINSALVASEIGSLNTPNGFVSFAENNANQIIFVDGQNGYLYTPSTGTFTQITTSGFPTNPTNVVFLDGYFVITSALSRNYQISALNDGNTWDILDNAVIQAYSGLNIGVGVVKQRLYFFKTDSTEVWYNSGAADFPFRRDNNLLFNYGCLAAASIVSGFDYLFWLSQDASNTPCVMMTQGQVPIKISTEAIEDYLQSFTSPKSVSAWIYKDEGHIFYKLNWTIDNVTLVYDLTTSMALGQPFWFREEMLQNKPIADSPYSAKTRGLGDCHAYFNGVHYIGSYKDCTLHEYSRNYGTNSGEIIKRERVTQHLAQPGYQMQRINALQLDFQSGIGDVNGQYRFPTCELYISRDGGRNYGNPHTAQIGALGKTRQRTIFRRLGRARDFVSKIVVHAPNTPVVLLGASIDLEVLPQ